MFFNDNFFTISFSQNNNMCEIPISTINFTFIINVINDIITEIISTHIIINIIVISSDKTDSGYKKYTNPPYIVNIIPIVDISYLCLMF
jgi:hypothetical protein